MTSQGAVELRRERLPPLGELEHDWRGLEAMAEPSFFTSWHWLGTLLSVLPENAQPDLLRGASGGKTVALALVGSRCSRRRGAIRSRGLYLNETGDPIFDGLTIEHNGFLAAPGMEDAALAALSLWFAQHRDTADEFYISGSLRRVPTDLPERDKLGRRETAVPWYCVDLSRLSRNGDVFSVLSANSRQQLRRAIRHYEIVGPLQLRRAGTATEALAFFTALKELHCATWEKRGKQHAFSGSFFERFHRSLIVRGFAYGVIELLKASAGNRAIGYLYNFRLSDRVYAYQSGFAYEDSTARPGIVTHALAIREAYRSGAVVYDFLAGHNRLKQSFATDCQPMLWQILQQPRLLFRLEDVARRAKAAFTELPRRRNLLPVLAQHDRGGMRWPPGAGAPNPVMAIS